MSFGEITSKCPLYVMQVKCTSDEYLDTLKTVSPIPHSRVVSAQTRVSGSGCLTVSERLLESNSEQWASDQGESRSSCTELPAHPQWPHPTPTLTFSQQHIISLNIRWEREGALSWNDYWRFVRIVFVGQCWCVCSSCEECKEVLQHKLKENLTKSPRLFFYWLNLLDQLARGGVCVENFGVF